MPVLRWTQDLSVKIAEIDNQHKELVNLINILHDSMKEEKGKDALRKALNDLVDYTVYHFETEERLFRKYDYPDYLSHKKEHDDLIKQVLKLTREYERDEVVITADLLSFLEKWLDNHIINVDKKYTSFLNSKGVV